MAAGVFCQIDVHTVTKNSPSTGVSFTHTVPHGAEISRFGGSPASLDGYPESSINKPADCNSLKDVHISARLLEDFLDLAIENTKNSLETCGVLGACLEERNIYVTNLIVPKQESTPNSCQALNEEEIFAIQSQQSLVPIGWIHTHPSQSCFMSSVDLHTQYSYQVMVPEAVGIVLAPNDESRKYGVFRLSDPVGMSILKECKEKGFHSHAQPADGSSIYENCSNVYMNPNLRLEVCDLR
ncbi:AMSH-like ubiquitin thioesterase 2 [Coffea eugenioides]|uniref:AMSH-like ubiquitin thioesterase 2 n=1 Tax=Coffea arabica TaxID=13443 RepID=A0A6P6VD47_COFAR|nr:AMSH-like ubiquitin thioesterase 2 [Coffea arabica]XP_027100546.1 AMSH-like ubiquitin thioesterase 2 [Coffea arabica]XP_027100547.1 AMSH-like ubiquitin thioesterase 2 [Coffea arabica]XP_027151170.1 AMSH-like ubiquitin thioesterase 2 [Coffea eugenioides]XP_027151171.1 AMSH-like ubiquitin thioesterase 2 [Coffea eugenioides]XP_027151172.1 AMSH-like ubiquitin thioesterase 2 [Coffea eugenioides]XP_027151173.1 AMSH-like ubiquitin thioesterase 2 [Coffea eugenioides]XP_027151174.1 AMSH-like ubiqu